MRSWLDWLLRRKVQSAVSPRYLPRREIVPWVAAGGEISDSEVIDAATGQRLVFAGQYRWHMQIRPADGKANVYLEILDVPVGPPPEVKL